MTTNKIAVIGLGYVGLPLAIEFAKKFKTVGFDINKNRIEELKKGHDRTLEISDENLKGTIAIQESEKGIAFSYEFSDMKNCNYFIITVPTPVTKNNQPDLTPLFKASETVGKVLKRGDIVIYESTVYPGVTEDECVPVLEKASGLKFNLDFFVGYSPERINPGDKEHTLTKILKVTSGSTFETANKVNELYKSIIIAGTYMAPSIRVAEAAKVIENSQRDINIAFVNELAKIFTHLNIDTQAVLNAAGTKWNFLPFKPGLVGGHCIGVDPYYLAQKAQETGYHPEIILAGRRMNDGMGKWIATQIIKLLIKNKLCINGCNILCLGITFKENCPDIRNTRAIDVINELKDYGCNVDVFDPWADNAEVKHEYNIDLIKEINIINYKAVILLVAHEQFLQLDLARWTESGIIIYDVKGFFDREYVSQAL